MLADLNVKKTSSAKYRSRAVCAVCVVVAGAIYSRARACHCGASLVGSQAGVAKAASLACQLRMYIHTYWDNDLNT